MTSCGYGMWMKQSDGKFAPVLLTAVSVRAHVVNLVAEVEVEQSYRNEASHPIQVFYKLPLIEGADLFKFSAEIDGRDIVSQIKEIVDGKVDYDEAVRLDPIPFMLQERLRDEFMVELGDLPAKSSANIRFTYLTKLKMEGDELRFMLPSTFFPHYVPEKSESVVTDFGSKLFSKTHHTKKVTCELHFFVCLSMTFGIKAIRSSTHKVSVRDFLATKSSYSGDVLLSETIATTNLDFLLFFKVFNPYEGSLVRTDLHSRKGRSAEALMLSILPKFKQMEHKAELIFVINRSSSMNGAGMQQAKRALLLLLHSLRVDCYVNIVGFGSKYHVLFPEGSRKYNDDVLKLVQDYAETMEADLGGSEIIEPLTAILELPTIDGYLRQVFVITDGLVSNKDEVIPLVQQLAGKARVFTLGLGSNVCCVLVEEIARAGNGSALFISIEEGLGGKVIDQLRDAFRPSWTDIKVEWDGFGEKDLMTTDPKLRQAPSNGMIPSVFSGNHLVVYALLEDGAYIPKNATLTVRTPDNLVLSIQVPVNQNPISGLPLIHQMAAKELIQGLQHQPSEASKKQIIKLATTYGLVSYFTSFVAVVSMDQTFWGAPIMMKSWDISNCLSSAMSAMSLGSSSPMNQNTSEPVSTNIKKEKLKGPVGEGKMMKVICLQKSNGSFKLDGTISKILDSSLDEIIEAGQKAKCPDELWPTLIAVSYLTLGLPQFRESWALVVEKANNWLDTLPFKKTSMKKKSDDFIKAKLKL